MKFPNLRYSLAALFIAWVACNLAWWLGSLPVLIGNGGWQVRNLAMLALIFGLNSGFVLFGVWLLLVLPLERFLGLDWSRRGALRGFLAALPFALAWVLMSGVFVSVQGAQVTGTPPSPVTGEVVMGTLPYVLATLVAGTAFGWARSRIFHRAV
jgi:hypothetical protein